MTRFLDDEVVRDDVASEYTRRAEWLLGIYHAGWIDRKYFLKERDGIDDWLFSIKGMIERSQAPDEEEEEPSCASSP